MCEFNFRVFFFFFLRLEKQIWRKSRGECPVAINLGRDRGAAFEATAPVMGEAG